MNASERSDGRMRRRTPRIDGLTLRQRGFLREKCMGLNDKDAALAAGYSLSVAENTKQKLWTPAMCAAFERMKEKLVSRSRGTL